MKFCEIRILTDENISPKVIKVYEQLLGLDTSISPGTILVIEETRIRIKYSEKNDN